MEGLLVDAGRQLHHAGRGLRGERGGDPGPGVLAEVGDRVGALADAAQQLPGRGQLRPARLVAVRGGHDPLRAPAARSAGAISPSGAAAPNHTEVAAVFAQQPDRPPGDPRGGQQHRRTVAYDGEGLLGVEGGGGLRALRAALPGGGVDDDPLGVQAQRHVVQEGLDAAGAGREVVRHDQGLVHRRRQYRAAASALPDGSPASRTGAGASWRTMIGTKDRADGREGPGSCPLAVWGLTRAVLLLCVFKVFTVPGPDVTSDVSVIYRGWYEVLHTGTYPLDDVTWQYPPAAALAVLSPASAALPGVRLGLLRPRPALATLVLRAAAVRGQPSGHARRGRLALGGGRAAARADGVRPLRPDGDGRRGGGAAGGGAVIRG